MTDPRIFYYAYDDDTPCGGQKDTYQHVDLLNAAGIESYVVHQQPGFRLNWFPNSTPVMDERTYRSFTDPAKDVIVLPEDLDVAFERFAGRKVISNKNLYRGFRDRGVRHPASWYWARLDVLGFLVVSEHNARHLRFAFPGKPVFVVSYDLRIDRFPFRPWRTKKPVIAFLPKALSQASALQQMLTARWQISANRSALRFQIVALEKMTEQEVACVLGDAILTVFLSYEEGLPRLPLEAMASGSLVAGVAAEPLTECLPREYTFPPGDLVSLAQFVEDATLAYPNMEHYEGLWEKGRRIAEAYTAERQSRELLHAWDRLIFQRPAHSGLPAAGLKSSPYIPS